MNFVLCECCKDTNYFCKNWNGKDDVSKRTHEVKEECESKDITNCEFQFRALVRKDCDWLYSTIAGSLPVEAEE